MADRVLFAWPGAAIMGDDRPRYVSVAPDFPGGSPVWGINGVIAALLARVAEAERLVEEARKAVASLPEDALGFASEPVSHPDGETALLEWTVRDELHDKLSRFLAGAPAAPPPPSLPPEVQRVLLVAQARVDLDEETVDTADGVLELTARMHDLDDELAAAVAALRARKEEQGG